MIYHTQQPNKTGREWNFANPFFSAWLQNLPSHGFQYHCEGRNHLFLKNKSFFTEAMNSITGMTFIAQHPTSSQTLLGLIPQIPDKLPHLTSLHLIYDFLPSIPPPFQNFTQVNSLILGGKSLSLLSDDFFDRFFPSLLTLGIYDCPLSSLPASITHLHDLVSLDLRYCPNITTLPDHFDRCGKLSSIRFEFLHGLKTIPPQLVAGTNLKKFLFVGYTDHITFPPRLRNYKEYLTNPRRRNPFKFRLVDMNAPVEKFW